MLISTYYAAIGDEVTYRLCLLIGRFRLSVGELAAALELPQPRVSHKLAKLRRYGLVDRSREGRRAYYVLSEPWRTLLLSTDEQWRGLSRPYMRQWRSDTERLARALGDALAARELH